jgi:two-component system sensor histidine kinase/response regulator
MLELNKESTFQNNGVALGKARVLIIDDLKVNCIMLASYVKKLNHEAHSVESGLAALELLKTEKFDLVLLDYEMPEIRGDEVLQRLKADPELRELPVIMISALDELEKVAKCIELGAEDYLPKPFNPVLLRARLNASLEKKRLRDRQAELQRKEIEALEKLSHLKDQFVNTVSHDLRNPIGAILGYADLLEDTLDESSTQARSYLAKMRKGGQQMLQLVNNLLDLAKIEMGGDMTLEKVNLAQFLHQHLEEFELLARQKQINLELIPPPAELAVRIDKLLMGQVVNNLLSNALKYTPAGGRVTLVGQFQGARALIQIKDTGFGIPAADIPMLFDKFYRVNTKNHRAVEGTGLGLSIVKAIVENHGGEIWVESELGQGSRFNVALEASNFSQK